MASCDSKEALASLASFVFVIEENLIVGGIWQVTKLGENKVQ